MGLRTEILEAMRNTALRLSLLTEFSQGKRNSNQEREVKAELC